jgi:hypothetical protein
MTGLDGRGTTTAAALVLLAALIRGRTGQVQRDTLDMDQEMTGIAADGIMSIGKRLEDRQCNNFASK